MSANEIRHVCAKHPDNALRLLRTEAGLQGSTRWMLLGTNAYITYCPWCGSDLVAHAELQQNMPATVHVLSRLSDADRAELDPSQPERKPYARPRILDSRPALDVVHSFDESPTFHLRFLISGLEPGERRKLKLVSPQAMDNTVIRGSDVRHVFLESLSVGDEEQVIGGAVPLELFQKNFDGGQWDLDIQPGSVVQIIVQNRGPETVTFDLHIASQS